MRKHFNTVNATPTFRVLPRDRDQPGDPFRPLEPQCYRVQFSTSLSIAQLQQVATLLEGRPDVTLYVYGRASDDLNFLQHLKSVRSLQIALFELEDISGFSYVQNNLKALNFGPTKKKFSLRFLENMPQLESLGLGKQSKDLLCIKHLGNLSKLGLAGITLPDLSPLLPLTGLRDLSIAFGGTNNLGLLPRFSLLENLNLLQISKLSDVSVLGDVERLKMLRLECLRNITSLPSCAKLAQLDNVELDKMDGLADISGLAAAPALRRLAVYRAQLLTADSFRGFINHPKLRELRAFPGKKALDEEIRRMFPFATKRP